jgi:alkylated DNA nucleotide flippase Atl1/predicted nuclease with RNAse H fold
MRVAAVKAHVTMGTYDRTPLSSTDAPSRSGERSAEIPSEGVAALTSSASVGIDVAQQRKGLDLVALDRDGNIVVVRQRLTVEAAVDLTISLQPAVVCIDSPSGWSRSGRSRLAERELATIGIQSYRTGPDPGDHPFYAWMRVGFEIFKQLSAGYPLYKGGLVSGTAAEVFPHATACLLAGTLRPRTQAKEQFRRRVLEQAGVRADQLRTLDHVDAALGALTGLIALNGGHTGVGSPDEGIILLPVSELPHTPLASGADETHLDAPSPRPQSDGDGASRRAASNERGQLGRAPGITHHRPPRSRPARSLDLDKAARFLAAIPAGRWTSYKDVATVAGNDKGAQAIGEWLRRCGHELPHVHRVIRSNGLVAEAFRAAGPGVPANAPSVRDLLRSEGLRFDLLGRASHTQRFLPADWRPD